MFDGTRAVAAFAVGLCTFAATATTVRAADEEGDLSWDGHIRWRPIRHLKLRAGASVYHFKLTIADVKIGSFERKLVTTQTLYGPDIGFGIFF